MLSHAFRPLFRAHLPKTASITFRFMSSVEVVSEKVRQEMAAKHQADPVRWSTEALAAHYSVDKDRVKGIISLMRQRYNLARFMGFSIAENGEIVVPALWTHLYHTSVNMPTLDMDTLGASVGMKGVDVKRAIEYTAFHTGKMELMQIMERYQQSPEDEEMSETDDRRVEQLNEMLGPLQAKIMEEFGAATGAEVRTYRPEDLEKMRSQMETQEREKRSP